jgi:RimJ/RimL family protein N-acetyltransferase
MTPDHISVTLRPWAEHDRSLLHRLLGEAAMMVHVGGPETGEQIDARHARYLAEPPGRLFAITVGDEGLAVGWVGYWEATWQGEAIWEMGWHVLPEFQGRGVASAATALALDRAAAERLHDTVHAFPSTANTGSNAVCRKAGFAPRGEVDVEYPKGRVMRANDWCATLPLSTCPECGCPLSAGRSCMDNFYDLLALEAEIEGAPGALPHFYAVASYGLQHPAAMGFTVATIEGLRESVALALSGDADVAQLRERSRKGSAAQGRVTRRGDEPVPVWPVASWPRTVVDVLARGPECYGDHVQAWAASIIDTTQGIDPRP